MRYIKKILKFIFSNIDIKIFERIIPFPIHKKNFVSKNSKIFKKKIEIWPNIVETIGSNNEIVFVEFGVWKGKSIKYFSDKFTNKSSVFFGLDSFEGLLESWGRLPKGYFDTDGKVPDLNDERVKFIKGIFQNTSEILLKNLELHKKKLLLVHFDADLYSYCLSQLDRLSRNYHVFFDEFTGEESRALYDYMKSHRAKFKIISQANRIDYDGYPDKMFGEIIHRNHS